MVNRILGVVLRQARESKGWSRAQVVELLPPPTIGERTLLSYEHGARSLTMFRFLDLCHVLEINAPALLARAMQMAYLYLDYLPLRIDLRTLLHDKHEKFQLLKPWVHNMLKENSDGIVSVEPIVVKTLAVLVGCTSQELANYLAQFLPTDTAEAPEDDE